MPTKPRIDMIGQKYGKLTVLERIPNELGRHGWWRCRCDCGNIKEADGILIRAGRIKSCGCLLSKGRYKDIQGQKYGKLTVLEPVPFDSDQFGDIRLQYWKCRCDCGTVLNVAGSRLRSGNTKSCGCTRVEKRTINLVGERFGMLEVLEQVESDDRFRDTRWRCRCDCGREVILSGARLRQGRIKSCGCARYVSHLSDEDRNLEGRRFGKLVVRARFVDKPDYWDCICDCGGSHRVSGSNLRAGNAKSCGCLRRRKQAEDMTHVRFGALLAVEQVRVDDGGNVIWRCQCDCGGEVEVRVGNLKSGSVTSCGCKKTRRRPRLPRKSGPHGYMLVQRPEHPNAHKTGYVFEHVLVMSEHLGRPIAPHETIHHINGDRADNRLENLELWTGKHGKGVRVQDEVERAKQVLAEYAPEALAKGG